MVIFFVSKVFRENERHLVGMNISVVDVETKEVETNVLEKSFLEN